MRGSFDVTLKSQMLLSASSVRWNLQNKQSGERRPLPIRFSAILKRAAW
jgi:hypothetical protein